MARLVLDKFGAFVGKKGERFVVKQESNKEEISSDRLSQILVLSGASFSSSAVKLAIENDIDVVFVKRNGTPYARIYPCKLGGTTLTRREQSIACFSENGVTLAKSFIKAKLLNQIYFLESLAKSRETNFDNECRHIMSFAKKIDELESNNLDRIKDKIFGLEGEATKIYYSCISKIIPEPFNFSERTRNPPKDKFNAMLSYGYGVLYSEIEKACIIAGLDPYLGFLHTDRYNKPSLVLDLIEQFRQVIVDRTVITATSQRQFSDSDFSIGENEVLLNEKGRQKLIELIYTRLDTIITYKGKKRSFSEIIIKQARSIAKFLLGENKKYTPFIYRW